MIETAIALGIFEALTRREKIGMGAAAATTAGVAPEYAAGQYGIKGFNALSRGNFDRAKAAASMSRKVQEFNPYRRIGRIFQKGQEATS